MLLFLLTVSLHTRPVHSFKVFWNVGGEFLHTNVSRWGIESGQETQTGTFKCSLKGCQNWTQGLWPVLYPEVQNSGLPQTGNLTAHLLAISAQAQKWIPDPNWSGRAVIDFEDWTPVWGENTNRKIPWYHSIRYQEASLVLCKDRRIAKERFQASGNRFFVESLKSAKMVRPKSLWGYYGLPSQHPTVNATWADLEQEIFDASNALYPSVYLYKRNASNYVRNAVAASVKRAKGKPVFAFHLPMYKFDDESTYVSAADTRMVLRESKQAGAKGVIIWGSQTVAQKHLNGTL